MSLEQEELTPALQEYYDRFARGRQAAKDLDPLSFLRDGLIGIAAERENWSGIPVPVHRSPLVIEPTYAYAGLNGFCFGMEKEVGEAGEGTQPKARNIFWSWRKRCWVSIIEEPDGRLWAGAVGPSNSALMILDTLSASDAWGIEQEGAAIDLLGKLLKHRQFKQYMLTGTFLESSKKSGLYYIFRRLRPTMAISPRGKDSCKVLCCLCMHPIGYYGQTWAGCMCPTDDVIAHLLLMRADEKMFWKRCSQHAPWTPEAGL